MFIDGIRLPDDQVYNGKMKYFTSFILLMGITSCVSPGAVLAPKELKELPAQQAGILNNVANRLEDGRMTAEEAAPIIRDDARAWTALDEYFNNPIVEDVE